MGVVPPKTDTDFMATQKQRNGGSHERLSEKPMQKERGAMGICFDERYPQAPHHALTENPPALER